MKRLKHHVKSEKPETSSAQKRTASEHDLAHFIHDRVELLHQVFLSIKPKDLRSMAPECVRHISLDDLQELCLEELLGISSKRLCAILDGAEPPSDTDSSSQSSEQLETISLDSISSDEDLLNQGSKKHKKHKHRRSKSKKKKRRSSQTSQDPSQEVQASRCGLTVLELLELQARARAIRAQLRAQHTVETPSTSVSELKKASASDNEVEIKEEPADVVEISSDDEDKKPVILTETHTAESTSTENQEKTTDSTTAVAKKINELVITVPQTQNRKIKLRRNKVSVTIGNNDRVNGDSSNAARTVAVAKEVAAEKDDKTENSNDKTDNSNNKTKEKSKKKRKDKKKADKEGSDHDEITLQLSDSEKMDLLEDFDRKNFDTVTSSEDSESSSSDSDDEASKDNSLHKTTSKEAESTKDVEIKDKNKESVDNSTNAQKTDGVTDKKTAKDESNFEVVDKSDVKDLCEIDSRMEGISSGKVNDMDESLNKGDVIEEIQNNEVVMASAVVVTKEVENLGIPPAILEEANCTNDTNKIETEDKNIKEVDKADTITINKDKNVSDGEVSDNSSSEVEAYELRPEVVCISDDEDKTKKQKKKKNKKEKKAKKDKKKKSKDFQESGDQNFFKDNPSCLNLKTNVNLEKSKATDVNPIIVEDEQNSNRIKTIVDSDDDDIYEIFELIELSDDSSCYEVEGVSVLSKEPTTEEIEALSAKIDEIEREEVVTDAQIKQLESVQSIEEQNAENISWKDRYLDSNKVKKVLSTSNILNALRKKNKELKNKIKASKNAEVAVKNPDSAKEVINNPTEENLDNKLDEGSIEHFNMLQGSNKYVDPIKEPVLEKDSENMGNLTEIDLQGVICGEMKKDAKTLLKMYKKLLKYNDMTKQKDPEKKKKKKVKKNKAKDPPEKQV